jgi:hypothetical protein
VVILLPFPSLQLELGSLGPKSAGSEKLQKGRKTIIAEASSGFQVQIC